MTKCTIICLGINELFYLFILNFDILKMSWNTKEGSATQPLELVSTEGLEELAVSTSKQRAGEVLIVAYSFSRI